MFNFNASPPPLDREGGTEGGGLTGCGVSPLYIYIYIIIYIYNIYKKAG